MWFLIIDNKNCGLKAHNKKIIITKSLYNCYTSLHGGLMKKCLLSPSDQTISEAFIAEQLQWIRTTGTDHPGLHLLPSYHCGRTRRAHCHRLRLLLRDWNILLIRSWRVISSINPVWHWVQSCWQWIHSCRSSRRSVLRCNMCCPKLLLLLVMLLFCHENVTTSWTNIWWKLYLNLHSGLAWSEYLMGYTSLDWAPLWSTYKRKRKQTCCCEDADVDAERWSR